LVMTVSCEL